MKRLLVFFIFARKQESLILHVRCLDIVDLLFYLSTDKKQDYQSFESARFEQEI